MNDVHRLGGGGRSGRLDGNVKIVIPPMRTGMDKGGGIRNWGKILDVVYGPPPTRFS